MQALQWALDQGGELERAVLICDSARLSAQNIGLSKAARSAITRDGHGGMAFARMLAHITYLSEQGMELKFGRERRAEGPMTMASDFEVEHYLDHQAEIFLARFDPLTYLYLSRVMDYFEPFSEPVAEAPSTDVLLVSFDTDWRFGSEHSRWIAEQLRAIGAAPTHVEVASPWGHDSFLMDVPAYHAAVADLLRGDERTRRRAR
jgi:homoserine O-acetyltransferase